MPCEIISECDTTAAAHTLRDLVLAGEHARADWQPFSRDPIGAGDLPQALRAEIDGLSVSLYAHNSAGDFSMLVSDTKNAPESTATIVYHLTLKDMTQILGRSQRQWLLDNYRAAINEQLSFASAGLGSRQHREARKHLATAQEMSCALQSVEGDSLKDLPRVRVGRHLHLVVNTFQEESTSSVA
jgi:hypothetical protein